MRPETIPNACENKDISIRYRPNADSQHHAKARLPVSFVILPHAVMKPHEASLCSAGVRREHLFVGQPFAELEHISPKTLDVSVSHWTTRAG